MKIDELWSGDALMLYAGAFLGFFGSRALFTWGVSPLVTAVLKVPEGEVRKGLKDPANYKEVTDIVAGAIVLAIPMKDSLKKGMFAGIGLSLIDHVIARFPAISGKLPK